MISNIDLRELNKEGILKFKDEQPTLIGTNIGFPAGILASLSPSVIFSILKKRTADEIMHRREKVMDWGDQSYYMPFIERTGQTKPYSDYAQPSFSNVNISFNEVNQYRFSESISYGNLRATQFDKINRESYLNALWGSATEALAVELNRTALFGYIENSSNKFVCYGLLNNPNLSNYESSAKTFDNMNWEEIVAFFGKAVAKLTTQTGNNINGDSNITCALASNKLQVLKNTYTSLGISVYKTLQDTYKNMKFVGADEFIGANNNEDVIYFIGKSMAGGVDWTAKIGYSELALTGNIVPTLNGYMQNISSGTCGTLISKPLFIVRYTNI